MATNKEIIERAYVSFGKGDIPAALGAFADDIEWTAPRGASTWEPTTHIGPGGTEVCRARRRSGVGTERGPEGKNLERSQRQRHRASGRRGGPGDRSFQQIDAPAGGRAARAGVNSDCSGRASAAGLASLGQSGRENKIAIPRQTPHE